MTDSAGLKFFSALAMNKRKDVRLKQAERKLEGDQKRMLTKYWKEKFDLFDDLIQINVKTPSFSERRTGYDSDPNSEERIPVGDMQLDSKLLSGRPVSYGNGRKKSRDVGSPSGRMTPVINVVGAEAICYPNSEAKRGRKVQLSPRVARRFEQVKTLSKSLDAINNQRAERGTFSEHPSVGHLMANSRLRPSSAPKPQVRSRRNSPLSSASLRPKSAFDS